MNDLHKAEAAAREALANTPDKTSPEALAIIAWTALRDLLAALDAARGEAVGEVCNNWSMKHEQIDGVRVELTAEGEKLPVGTKLFAAPPAALADAVHVFNCHRCPVSVESRWQPPECPECGDPCALDSTAKPAAERSDCKATPCAVPVNTATLNYVAGLLRLSDHHLTNGPHPIERGETYWKAQAAVAIGGVNECAMLAAAARAQGVGNE